MAQKSNRKSGIRPLEIGTYSLGSLGREVSNNVVNVFLLAFLNIYMGLDAMALTIAFTVVKLLDAVIDPLLASMVNNSKRGRFGRFRPWIALGAALNCGALMALFWPAAIHAQAAKYVYYISMYFLWGTTFSLVDVPFWSMIPAIANSTDDRNKVTSLAKLIGGFGGFVISSIGTSLLIPLVSVRKGVGIAHFALGATAGGMLLCFMLVTALCNKETYDLPQSNTKLRDFFALFRRNDQLGALTPCRISSSFPPRP
jgi:melibiose permease